MYMNGVEIKVKRSIIYLAIVFAIALCVTLFSATFVGSIVANAEEDNYAFNMTTTSFVYDGKERELPLEVTKNGEKFTDYTITYSTDGNPVESAKNVGNYVATITVNGVTPAVQTTFNFTVTPKPLDVVIGGANTFQYTGMGYTRDVSPLGICKGDDCDVITTYVGNNHALEPGVLPSHADSYDMQFSTSNPNYVIGNVQGDTTLIIQKRTLYVKVNNVSIKEGETPNFTMDILGYVAGDDESCIERMPTVVSNAVVVGVHQINASNGVAENYDFVYTPGYLTINGLSAVGGIEETSITIDANGVFAPSTVYVGRVIDVKSDEAKELVRTARRYRMLNFTSKASQIYQIDVENGAQISEKVKVSLSNFTSLNANENYFIVVIDPNGVVTKITKYEYINGTLSFTAPSLGTVIIFEDSYNMTVLYITIAIVAVFILALFLAERIQYRNDKRRADELAEKKKAQRNKDGYRW